MPRTVTNLRNGKSAICRIIDRGPFVRGRVIDVSRGMAAWQGSMALTAGSAGL